MKHNKENKHSCVYPENWEVIIGFIAIKVVIYTFR